MKRIALFLLLGFAAVIAIYLSFKTTPPIHSTDGVGATGKPITNLPSSKTSVSETTLEKQQPSPPSPSTADAPTSVQQYIEKKEADPQYDWKRPINFYGRVVDENNTPVTGASVDFVWTDLSPNGSSESHTTSDGNGFFSLQNQTGKRLQVTVSKDGYYTPKGEKLSSFEYANPGDGLFTADLGHPVVFHLRKKGEGANLLSKNFEISIAVGKTVSVPLDNQTALEVELLTNAPMSQKQWAARVNVTNGELQPALDEFPFEAPVDGYESVLELNLDTPKPPTWMNLYQGGEFYIKTASGYGRLELKTISGKSFMDISVLLNLTGSRNLEPK